MIACLIFAVLVFAAAIATVAAVAMWLDLAERPHRTAVRRLADARWVELVAVTSCWPAVWRLEQEVLHFKTAGVAPVPPRRMEVLP